MSICIITLLYVLNLTRFYCNYIVPLCAVWAPLAALTLLAGVKRGRILSAPPREDKAVVQEGEQEEGEGEEEEETIFLGTAANNPSTIRHYRISKINSTVM